MNRLIPGKGKGALVLVANHRTLKALPGTVGRRVVELPENGVDLGLWRDPGASVAGVREYPRFIYFRRLIPLKAVGLLVSAFFRATRVGRLGLFMLVGGPGTGRLAEQG